jgi:hypothetical protein
MAELYSRASLDSNRYSSSSIGPPPPLSSPPYFTLKPSSLPSSSPPHFDKPKDGIPSSVAGVGVVFQQKVPPPSFSIEPAEVLNGPIFVKALIPGCGAERSGLVKVPPPPPPQIASPPPLRLMTSSPPCPTATALSPLKANLSAASATSSSAGPGPSSPSTSSGGGGWIRKKSPSRWSAGARSGLPPR